MAGENTMKQNTSKYYSNTTNSNPGTSSYSTALQETESQYKFNEGMTVNFSSDSDEEQISQEDETKFYKKVFATKKL